MDSKPRPEIQQDASQAAELPDFISWTSSRIGHVAVVNSQVEGECTIGTERSSQTGQLVWPVARLRLAPAPFHAGVCAGSGGSDSGGGADALVAQAASRGRAALSAHRCSHRAAVRILASGDCV